MCVIVLCFQFKIHILSRNPEACTDDKLDIMIRKWISKFSKSVNERAAPRRRELHLPIKISFVPDRKTGSLQMPMQDLSIAGETRDLSKTGLAFQVPSIRIKEAYLVGEGRTLNAEVSLPIGKVTLQLKGERYQQVGGEHLSISEYIVGAKIVHMSNADKEIYEEFLTNKKQQAGSLNLGTHKSKA